MLYIYKDRDISVGGGKIYPPNKRLLIGRIEMTIEHGGNTVIVKGNIINVTLIGAFNEYDAKNVSKKIKKIVEGFNLNKFLMLMNLSNWDGATPEAFTTSNEFNEWLNSQNMVAKAIVITSQTVKAIDQQWVPSKLVQNIEYFDNEGEALRWLEKQL